MNKLLVYFLLTITTGFLLSACNTFEGMGKDIESLGRNVEDAAD